jgi:hypothetical protein
LLNGDDRRRKVMRGAVLHAPGDIRVEEREDPKILAPTDVIIRLSATCICGSDLWPYRGIEAVDGPSPMGHEYAGTVQEVGSEVTNVRPGQFVVGSFFASDNTCPICRAGYQSSCIHREGVGANGAQAEYLRVPLADASAVVFVGGDVADAGVQWVPRWRRRRARRMLKVRGGAGRGGGSMSSCRDARSVLGAGGRVGGPRLDVLVCPAG